MSAWLCPISERAGRVFHLDDGSKRKVSVESYAELVKNGRLSEDEVWGVSTNFLTAKTGDEVFIYTGDQDLGIIGYAKILKVDCTNPAFHLAFDLKKCEALLDTPIPASLVRKWVLPRRAVANLIRHLPKLNSLLPWKGGRRRKEAERTMPRSLGAGFGVDHERNKKVELAAIRAVTDHYCDKGWSVDPTYQIKRLGFDLLCSKGLKVKKVEVKGICGGSVCFMMTAGERKTSKDKDFVLHVVCNALSKQPSIRTWSGQQLEGAFAFTEIQYQARLRKV